MSGRRLTFDEALARLNELLEDVDPDAIEALRQRMLRIATPPDEGERLWRLVFCAVLGCPEFPTVPVRHSETDEEYRLCVRHAGELEHPFGDEKCGTCGEPATMAARHVVERWDPTAADEQFEPGKTRYGCDEHPVESAIVRVTDTIAQGVGIPREELEDSEP